MGDKEVVIPSTLEKMGGRSHSAFFYGTLMAPEVLYTVCYRTSKPPTDITKLYTFKPAILHGFSRRRVKYADYPGITKDQDHVVRGTFVTGLTDANMERLDFFEGGQYERKKVTVKSLAKVGDDKGQGNEEGEDMGAEVYVFKDRYKGHLEDAEWDFEEFRRDKLQKWTIVDHAFEGCDEDDLATVAADDN